MKEVTSIYYIVEIFEYLNSKKFQFLREHELLLSSSQVPFF